jgi:GAF domain-containing protein
MSHLNYSAVSRDIRADLAHLSDPIEAMTRAVEILKNRVPYYTWVGVYLLSGEELILGPFLGAPSPHTRIPLGRGICGAAASEKRTIIVDDVTSDPRYLACSLDTRSEIVVPITRGDHVIGEIDIDSDTASAFGERDRSMLEEVAQVLSEKL